jgi:UDP-glucose 4-epimerase
LRALVTGGAGFIGSNLVDGLLDGGAEVHAVDDLTTGKRENLSGALARGAHLHVTDVAETAALADVVAGARPETVFHLAAQVDVRRSVTDPAFDARVNVTGTVNVLEAARRCGARRVVLASTSAVYGDPDSFPIPEAAAIAPLSPYGAAKAAAEEYLAAYSRLYGLSTLSLRLANVYGPRQDPHGEAGVVAIFCGARAAGRTARIFGDGRQTRDYIYVGDVVAAFRAAADSEATGAMNVGTGLETDLLELAAALDLQTEHAAPRPGEIARSSLDPSRAERELGWRAVTPLPEGLRRTLAAVA